MDLRGINLNLLLTLDALLAQRSVNGAATQLGLSQPATSAQVSHLRRHFGDPLLARSGNQYRLTALAIQLRPSVQAAVAGAERVFAAAADFDPATSHREFRLLASDYCVAVLGPGISRLLSAEAPGARLRFAPSSPTAVDEFTQSPTGADLLLLPRGFGQALAHRNLHQDTWVCLVAEENSAVGDTLTPDELMGMPWVVSHLGAAATTLAARQLQSLGLEPDVQVVTESFLTLAGFVEGTDRVALVQGRLARRLTAVAAVRVVPCPLALDPLVEAMWWHQSYEQDPEHRFLRSVVRRAAERLDVANHPAEA